MSGDGLWVLLVAIEIAAIPTIALIIILVRGWMRRRRDQAAIATLIARVRQARPQREEEWRSLLAGPLGLAEEEAAGQAQQLTREELLVYQAFANLYLHHDAAQAATFDTLLGNALAITRKLDLSALGGAEDTRMVAAGGEAADRSEEVERLAEENRRLKEELQVSMDTMSRMVQEYSQNFVPPEEAEAAAATAKPATPADDSAPAASPAEAAAEPDLLEEFDFGDEPLDGIQDIGDLFDSELGELMGDDDDAPEGGKAKGAVEAKKTP